MYKYYNIPTGAGRILISLVINNGGGGKNGIPEFMPGLNPVGIKGGGGKFNEGESRPSN